MGRGHRHNPLYHWSHLELRRFFGYKGTLSARTADEVWNLCNRKLQSPGYSVRGVSYENARRYFHFATR